MVKVTATENRETGSRASRRLRRAGKVPAVMYGKGMPTKNLVLDAHEFAAAMNQRFVPGILLEVEVGGKANLVKLAEIVRHPVRRELTHLDFLAVGASEETEASVELVADGVELFEQAITVRGPASAIPATISVKAPEGKDVVAASDLPLPSGVVLVSDPETQVARVLEH